MLHLQLYLSEETLDLLDSIENNDRFYDTFEPTDVIDGDYYQEDYREDHKERMKSVK